MGLFTSLFKGPASQPAEDHTTSGGLWRRTEFSSFTLSDDLQLACRRDADPQVLPAFVLDFVLGCEKFRPLPEQIAAHAEKHGWNTLQVEALESWLPKVIDARLMISSSEVRAQCTRIRPEGSLTPASISALGFPTGGARVQMLDRSISSFAENLKAHGRTADFLVADSSASAEHQLAFQQHLQGMAAAKGIRIGYAGETEKRRFAAEIAKRVGCDPRVVEFALLDVYGTGFACGANRNALLLAEAGRMLASIDDDVLARFATIPGMEDPGNRWSLFSGKDPFLRRLFADRESVAAAAQWVERDFLAEHEAMLGRHVGEFMPQTIAEDDLDLSKAGDEILSRLDRGMAAVRATFTGHLGDPGIPTSVYYLYYEDENRRNLTQDEGHYRSVFSSRSVFTVVPNRTIGDASVSPGMAMGLDAREVLPPFFPVLHAEDFVYGATLWQCDPASTLGHLPFAVLHEPPPGKPILTPDQLGEDRRAVIFEFAHVLRRIVFGFTPGANMSAHDRTIALGRHLRDWASRPPADFREFWRNHVLAHESEKCGYLEEQLDEDYDTPEFWREDVESYLRHVRDAMTYPDFDIPYDLKSGRSDEANRTLIQALIADFGQLLEAWPAIFNTACELRESGSGLMRWF